MGRIRDQSHCCGGGGGILATDQEMSDTIAQERINEAVATGTNMVVTACPTCEQVLKKAAQSLEGKPLVVRDLSDLLWQALK